MAVGTVIAVVAGILAANPAARWSEFKQVGALESRRTYVAAHLSSGRGSGRYQFWSAALDAFEAHPLDGIGAGGYEAYWDQHGTLAMPVRNAHSLFFETMAELGIVGLLLVLGFLGFAAVAGVRRGSDPLARGRCSAPRWPSSPRAWSRRRSTGPGSFPPASAWSCSRRAAQPGRDARAGGRRSAPSSRR